MKKYRLKKDIPPIKKNEVLIFDKDAWAYYFDSSDLQEYCPLPKDFIENANTFFELIEKKSDEEVLAKFIYDNSHRSMNEEFSKDLSQLILKTFPEINIDKIRKEME